MVTRVKAAAAAFILGIVLAVAGPAFADRFIYFGSANGLLKGDVHSYQTTTATGADVTAVFTGSCNSGTFLGGDGVCRAVGAPTGSALTRVNDTNVTVTLGGTPASALLASTSLTMGWSGTLAAARGGTDGVTPTDDNAMVGNGTVWQGKALPSCSSGSSALTYNTSTNAYGCNTITSGVTVTASGSGTISWDDACTTTPTSPFTYVLTSDNRVSFVLGPMTPNTCTGDSVNMRATSTSTLPVAIRPTVSQYIAGVFTQNNGSNATGCMGFANTGILDVTLSAAAGCGTAQNWTSSAGKSVGLDHTVTLMYSLN